MVKALGEYLFKNEKNYKNFKLILDIILMIIFIYMIYINSISYTGGFEAGYHIGIAQCISQNMTVIIP